MTGYIRRRMTDYLWAASNIEKSGGALDVKGKPGERITLPQRCYFLDQYMKQYDDYRKNGACAMIAHFRVRVGYIKPENRGRQGGPQRGSVFVPQLRTETFVSGKFTHPDCISYNTEEELTRYITRHL